MSRSLAALSLLIAGGVGLAALAPPGICGDGDYVVVRGDTLGRVARRCGSTVAAIAAASRIADPNLILVGQRLVIPGGRAFARAVTRPAPATDATGRLTYAMARGDTLYSLARWSRVSLPALLAANPGINPQRIEIGDTIRLPGGAARPQLARLRERGPLPRAARPSTAPVVRDAPPPRSAPRAAPRDEEEADPIGM